MSKWQILGIVPTNDQRQIKKAYAVKLKQLDVEADPKVFKR